MDCKRPYKYRPLNLLLTVACLLLSITSCTWVPDETEECPYGFWLKIRYTYNILDVEAAPRYINDVTVYIYDSGGKYVNRIYASRGELEAQDYKVKVQDLPEGDYQFVVWSGTSNSQYSLIEDTQPIETFRLALNAKANISNVQLPALFHGYLPTVHYSDSYAIHNVEMVKNTNQLNCLIVSVDKTVTLDPAEYVMSFVADNGTMDAHNQLDTKGNITYEPYSSGSMKIDDPDYGALSGLEYNISTLRLLKDQNSRVILKKKSTGKEIFNISFPEYMGMIGSFYTNLGRPLSVQEYLDRQDFYTVVFFLSGDLEQLIQLQVNSWRLRAYNHLKL